MYLKRCLYCDVAMLEAAVLSSRHDLFWKVCPQCSSLYGYNKDDELRSMWQGGFSEEGAIGITSSTRIWEIPEGSLAVMER